MSNGATPNLLEQARAQYPILRNLPYAYVEHINEKDPRALEHWPPGEQGSQASPRPKEIPLDQYGIEVINRRTRPIDVLGDVVSHHLVQQDPKIKGYYRQFINSMTDSQVNRLQSQWMHETGGQGDFISWAKQSGLPAAFRGHAFQQWDANDFTYTPEQLTMFDQMMQYLGQGKANDQKQTRQTP